ncbi:MAG: sugar ABC transporter permease [Arhodomonas sp.]|nr:sugar ABC transporter permease [Arhodomonas sp.]
MSTVANPRRPDAPAPAGLLGRIGEALERPGVLGAVMLAPAVLYVVFFVAVPFMAILLSLSDATAGDPRLDEFVGLSNFVAVMQQEAFWTALWNSLIITGATVGLIVVLATIAVEFLAREFRGKRLVQVLFMMPWAMPVSLAAITWLWAAGFAVQPHRLGPGADRGARAGRHPGPGAQYVLARPHVSRHRRGGVHRYLAYAAAGHHHRARRAAVHSPRAPGAGGDRRGRFLPHPVPYRHSRPWRRCLSSPSCSQRCW